MKLLSVFTFIAVFLVMISLITPIVDACVLVLIKTTEEHKFTLERSVLDCHAGAMATVSHTPGGPTISDSQYDCSVSVKVRSPIKPDGTYDAVAGAGADCKTHRIWTGSAINSGTGWSASTGAGISEEWKTENIDVVVNIVTWQVYYYPFHSWYCVIYYESTTVGVTIYDILIQDVTNNQTLFNSTTVFTGTDPDIVWDSTGRLYWEKFTYESEDGEVYENAYRPGDIEILLKEYEMELDPHESVNTILSLELKSSLNDAVGSGVIGHEMSYVPTEGGISIPVDKLALLAPYISATSIILISAVASAVYIKHVRCKKENE